MRASRRPGSSTSSRSLEQQRSENGGYTDAEMDGAILRSQRSDPVSVAMRLVAVATVYWLLGRAVAQGMGAAYLLLPLLAELLAMFWIGLLLSRTVVRCKAFRRSAGSGVGVVVWTLIILGGVAAWLARDPAGGGWALSNLPAGARLAWETSLRFGLHWAVLAALAGLIVATLREVLAWKPEQGVFVWTSIITTGTRIGLALLFGTFGFIAAAVLGVPLTRADAGLHWPWITWTLLLLLDVGVVVVLALMHRDFKRKAAKG